MMHPIDDDNSNNEQEVVFDAICVDFDDDEDDDENDHPRSPTRPNDSTPRLHTTSTSNNNTSNDRNNSPLLTHFQPLLENSVAAHVAANDLEVFLSSNPDDDTAIVAPQRIDPTITRIQTYNSSNRVSSSTLAAPDDDDDDNLLYLSSPTPPTLTTTIVPSHWQPLVASSPTPIVDNPEHKNNHLPSHYIVQNNVNNYNNQATPNSNISSSFLDPFAFPQHQQPHPDSTTEAATTNDASLMDFTSDDDDCNEGDLTTIRTPTNMNTMTTPLRNTHATHRMVPGSAGFLEMEEEPPRTTPHSSSHSSVDPEQTFATQQQQHQQAWTNSNGISINSNSNANSLLLYEPMQTSSGLLLTHRRLPPPSTTTPFPIPDQHHHHHHQHQQQPHSMRTRFEFDTASSRDPHGNNNPQQSLWSTSSFSNSTIPGFSSRLHPPHPHSPVLSLPPLLRTVRLSVLVSALVLLVGTVVLLHHSTAAVGPTTRHSNTNNNNKEWLLDEEAALDNNNDMQGIVIPLAEDGEYPDRIILLPLPEHGFPMPNNNKRNHNHHRRLSGPIVWEQTTNPDRLMGVPAFFEDTVEAKPLTSIRREDNRVESIHHRHLEPLQQINPLPSLRAEFEEWKDRHNKTYHSEKEGQHRFRIWSNNHHNTAAKNERHGPCLLTGKQVFGSNHFQDLTVDEFQLQYLTGYSLKREPVMQGSEPKVYPPILDPSVHVPNRHPEVHQRILQRQMSYSLNYQAGCKWYDVSCHLRYIFQTYFYGMGGTMEPRYDANSYPTAIDWRDYGAVTEIHSQGSCGACWAITAVETVESAYFIAKAKLYDLAETEVIVCEQSCEMCSGGWPQEAFDYVISNSGLPLESDMTYNADYLLLVSEQVNGNSDELSGDTVKGYQQTTCPSSGGNGGGGGGHSGDAATISGTNSFTRYGKIKGYGYSTAKCVCYTDGSGCDCENQNEGYAVRNIATYGPAVVCLDASVWQDYTDGIITSSSGCSSGFMDVNHCVQVVGYAYMADGEAETGEGSGDKGSKSNSGSGSGDSSQRQGYWIVRNQWSKYWGMNGYAYVAMGVNTCGILNDMLQAYT